MVTFYLTKLKNRNNAALILLPEVKLLFCQKKANFLKRNADINKIKDLLVLKNLFSQTTYVF